MAKQKTPREGIVTPYGIARYPRLNSPDTKFDAEGVYKVDLVLDPDADPKVNEFVQELEAFAEKHGKPTKNIGVKADVGDDGQPTGKLVAKFKVAAKWADKPDKPGESRKPSIVDRAKNVVEGIVGGGSVIRISGEMSAYDGFGGGVTLTPLAVQVKELKQPMRGVGAFDDDDDGDEDFGSEETGAAGADEPEF